MVLLKPLSTTNNHRDPANSRMYLKDNIMSEEKKKRGFQPGNQLGNRNGRPTQPKGKPVSKLRSTLAKLRQLEPKALENIEKSVNGEEVDKASLDTSKWVISTSVSISKAATAEEATVHGIRSDLAGDNEPEEKEDEEPKVRFQLHCLPTKADLE